MFGENDTFVVSGLFFPLSQTINFFFPLFAPFHDITFISHAKVHDIIPIAWNQITRVHFSSYLDFVFASFSLVAFFSSFTHFCTLWNSFPSWLFPSSFILPAISVPFVFYCFFFAWSIFWREFSLLLLFIFKRLPNTRFLVHALLLQFLESI